MKKLMLVVVAALSMVAISGQASARCYTWWEDGVKYRSCDRYYYDDWYYGGWRHHHHHHHRHWNWY